jgi:hypothetical protein
MGSLRDGIVTSDSIPKSNLREFMPGEPTVKWLDKDASKQRHQMTEPEQKKAS